MLKFKIKKIIYTKCSKYALFTAYFSSNSTKDELIGLVMVIEQAILWILSLLSSDLETLHLTMLEQE